MAKYMDGGKKSPAERLRDKLIEKGFDAFIYESPLDALAKRAAVGEKVDINMYFAGKTPIKDFVENQDSDRSHWWTLQAVSSRWQDRASA